MLSLFTNSKPWMVASLFVATAAFGQQDSKCAPKSAPKCEQPAPCAPKPACTPCVKVCPCPKPKPVLPAAYNAPAGIDLRCAWDVNVNASFIYWQAMQDNMELGFSSTGSVANQGSALDGDYVNMNFGFKPGFKVGLGFATDHDDWDIQAEYTWFHGKRTTSTNGPAAPGSLLPMWTVTGMTGTPTNATYISQSWRLNMDIVDLNMGRAYYVGKKLTMRPSLGARAAFIRQRADITNQNNGTIAGAATIQTEFDSLKTNSWGVGTAVGLETNWMIGEGFRLFGNGEADLLFTRYTKANRQSSLLFPIPTYYANMRQKNINTMRTHINIGSGLGYGTYLDCNNWYLDISAAYEFQVFFDQNMFRHLDGNNIITGKTPNGNLYIQGLTLTMQIDF